MARSANPTVSIVIPARNEARNLEIVLPRLPDVEQIILVDGNSMDGTVGAAQRARGGITGIRQTRTGRGNALRCGFDVATGGGGATLEREGSTDPWGIRALVRGRG